MGNVFSKVRKCPNCTVVCVEAGSNPHAEHAYTTEYGAYTTHFRCGKCRKLAEAYEWKEGVLADG